MKTGDKVLSNSDKWSYGVHKGYNVNPGEIVAVHSDVIEVKWQDGHMSVHSEDELLLAPSA